MSAPPNETPGHFDPNDGVIPRFEPHPWWRNGHAQTVVGRFFPGRVSGLDSAEHRVEVGHGDRVSVLESIPGRWRAGDPAAILVHGLGGCAGSPYVIRCASRFSRAGIRVIRMNLRGAGSGFGLARSVYHAGLTDDLRRVIEWLAGRAPESPVALVGFSLGAGLALKLAAEAASRPVAGLDCVLAANPPIDLAACSRLMGRPANRLYDRNFVRWLRGQVVRLHRAFPELGTPALGDVRSLYEFDDRYTAPRNGFDSADDYYTRSSAGPLIPKITLPGLVVHAEDDPFIPVEPFRDAAFPANLSLELTRHGGHLGYLSHSPWLGDRRWLDARLETWLRSRWGIPTNHRDAVPSLRDGRRLTMGVCDVHA